MTDHLFAATLTFALLAGGTAAIGSELLRPGRVAAAATASTVPQVTLPAVMVVGRRPVSLATAGETAAARSRRMQ